MANKPRLSSEIRDWVQALVIVVGLGVGIWQFQVKEIWNPASAPINITTEVSVKEAGFKGAGSDKSQQQFEAIELSVTAKNPSSRDVFLLKNCWYAQGLTTILNNRERENWIDHISKQIEENAPVNEGAFYALDKVPMVESGEIFREDHVLHPNEAISASVVFYLPQELFDALYVHVSLPTIAVEDSAEVDWLVTRDRPCSMRLFRKRNGARAEEIKDGRAAYKDRHIEFQTADSTRELSLWQSKAH